MARYAAETEVSVERSRMEIEKTLHRYGADAFGYYTDNGKATIAFRMAGRQIKFALTLPPKDRRDFTHHSRGMRTPEAAAAAYEQACRQRWRALALCVKAKLEAVETGISTFDDEFLAATVLPDGRTVGEWAKPQVEQAYLDGQMPTHLMLTDGTT